MTKQQNTSMTLDQLSKKLEVYGADLSRMPDNLQSEIVNLINADPAAKKIMGEATALDTLLNFADKSTDIDVEDLEARIMSTVLVDESINSPINDNVRKFKLINKNTPPPEIINTSVATANWAATGLLAASLILGLALGALGMSESIFSSSPDMVSVNSDLAEDILSFSGEYYFGEL